MRKPRLSLFSKTLFWLSLNLAVLPAILLVASIQFNHQIIIHDVLAMQGHARMRKAFHLITGELGHQPEQQWNATLSKFAAHYGVDFVVIFADGSHFASMPVALDDAILSKVRYSIDQVDALQREESQGKAVPLLPENNPLHPDLLMQTGNPSLFWTGVVIEIPHGPKGEPTEAMVSAVSDSVTGRGFLFEPLPWLLILGAVVLVTILIWLPIIHRITRPLGRMMLATERIARGDFQVSLPEDRGDEIGRLAKAINRMSDQLSHLLKGHKRFMGDVAHELGSPIARIQYGLGALGQRVDEGNQQRVQGIMEDVEHMSSLVQELLALSRAEIDKSSVVLVTGELLPMVETAVRRESRSGIEIQVAVAPGIRVVACPNLLVRAISNLIRNSIKYAGQDGPISITASLQEDSVILEVCDCGPGVPEAFFGLLFEPFYRPEPSRDRDSGGVGLGLAIVKTCIESSRGTVAVRNLQPRGFAVTLKLVRAFV